MVLEKKNNRRKPSYNEGNTGVTKNFYKLEIKFILAPSLKKRGDWKCKHDKVLSRRFWDEGRRDDKQWFVRGGIRKRIEEFFLLWNNEFAEKDTGGFYGEKVWHKWRRNLYVKIINYEGMALKRIRIGCNKWNFRSDIIG